MWMYNADCTLIILWGTQAKGIFGKPELSYTPLSPLPKMMLFGAPTVLRWH